MLPTTICKVSADLPLFVVELALANGNASEASRNLGWDPSKGRRLVAEHPELREAVRRAGQRLASSELVQWQEAHAEARRRVISLMRSDDPRIALEAAKYIIERVEGKVANPVADEPPTVSLDSVLMRFIASLHMLRGLSIAEASEYAKQHPDQVEVWGRKHGLIKASER